MRRSMREQRSRERCPWHQRRTRAVSGVRRPTVLRLWVPCDEAVTSIRFASLVKWNSELQHQVGLRRGTGAPAPALHSLDFQTGVCPGFLAPLRLPLGEHKETLNEHFVVLEGSSRQAFTAGHIFFYYVQDNIQDSGKNVLATSLTGCGKLTPGCWYGLLGVSHCAFQPSFLSSVSMSTSVRKKKRTISNVCISSSFYLVWSGLRDFLLLTLGVTACKMLGLVREVVGPGAGATPFMFELLSLGLYAYCLILSPR